MAEPYLNLDEHGVWRVANTHVMADSVIAGFEEGQSAETIQSHYPALTLEQVYGAITYYLAHREQMETYLQQQNATWAKWRSEAEKGGAPVVRRLRAQRRPSGLETA